MRTACKATCSRAQPAAESLVCALRAKTSLALRPRSQLRMPTPAAAKRPLTAEAEKTAWHEEVPRLPAAHDEDTPAELVPLVGTHQQNGRFLSQNPKGRAGNGNERRERERERKGDGGEDAGPFRARAPG